MILKMAKLSVDELEFKIFVDWVKSTDWMIGNIPEDKVQEESLRRAIAATKKLLLVNPYDLMYKIAEEASKLQRLLLRGDTPVDEIISQALTVSSLLMLFAALKELKNGVHGGDVAEALSFAIKEEVDLYNMGKSDIRQLREGLYEQAGRILYIWVTSGDGEI